MFANVSDVKEITGYDVTYLVVAQAQAIIESYIGRFEIEVSSTTDLLLLERAVAYQAAYMTNDPMKVYEQVAFKSIGQFGQLVSLRDSDSASPFIAPMAVMACRNLSWKRMRSIKTGGMFSRPSTVERWETQ